MDYVPDSWVILELPNNNGHKIAAGWDGGYTHGSSWKVNSGITKIEEVDHSFIVHGYSGSIYSLFKTRNRISTSNMFIITKMENLGCKIIDIKDILEKYKD